MKSVSHFVLVCHLKCKTSGLHHASSFRGALRHTNTRTRIYLLAKSAILQVVITGGSRGARATPIFGTKVQNIP